MFPEKLLRHGEISKSSVNTNCLTSQYLGNTSPERRLNIHCPTTHTLVLSNHTTTPSNHNPSQPQRRTNPLYQIIKNLRSPQQAHEHIFTHGNQTICNAAVERYFDSTNGNHRITTTTSYPSCHANMKTGFLLLYIVDVKKQQWYVISNCISVYSTTLDLRLQGKGTLVRIHARTRSNMCMSTSVPIQAIWLNQQYVVSSSGSHRIKKKTFGLAVKGLPCYNCT
jgi:hypothetical protein